MISAPPAAPLASMATVSLVLVSPSMEMLLKDLSTAGTRRLDRADGAIGASVHTMASRVAMFGWIMPAPLVMPTIEYVTSGAEGNVKVRERSLGNVSVVHIARAVLSQCSCVLPKT